MTLEPQKAQKSGKAKTKIKTGAERQGPEQKRQRRKAPSFTLMWSEEVLALSICAREIIELRTKARWRMNLAEAALNDDPAVAKLGGQAHANDAIWSKFQVGRHWFCLDFRPGRIREYVVKLADPPSPTDAPSAGVRHEGAGRDVQVSIPHGDRDTGADGSSDAMIRGITREITVRWRLTKRQLSRRFASCETRIRSILLSVAATAKDLFRSVRYTMTVSVAEARTRLAELTEAIASCRNSSTRMEAPPQHVGVEARLEPRCVAQNSGMNILIYSWERVEPQTIDWSADLFGVNWPANLFGVLPEEERAFT